MEGLAPDAVYFTIRPHERETIEEGRETRDGARGPHASGGNTRAQFCRYGRSCDSATGAGLD